MTRYAPPDTCPLCDGCGLSEGPDGTLSELCPDCTSEDVRGRIRAIRAEWQAMADNPPNLRDYAPDVAAYHAAHDAYMAAGELLQRRAEYLRGTV